MAPDLLPPDPPLGDGVIRLRPLVPGDVDALTRSGNDPEVQRFIPVPRPYRRADGEAYVARTIREWAEGTKAAFAIVEGTDDELVGVINVALSGAVGNSGYWVAPGARGRGVARRALTLVTEWAFSALGLGVILLEIRPENAGSRRVAEAAGYHEAGRIDVNTATGKKGGLIYTRLASDPR